MSAKYRHCELLYEDGVNNLNRVVKLPDGSLFTLAWSGKNVKDMGTFPKRQFVFSRRSADGGRAWTLPAPLFEIPETRAYASLLEFMISRAGFLHVFIVRITTYDWQNTVFQGDILHARMDDVTGKGLRISKIGCLDRYTGSLNNLIQLRSGRLLVPFSTLRHGEGVFVSSTVRSDDEGATWQASNDVGVVTDETNVESGAVEPVVAETRDGRVVMLIRTVNGWFYWSVSRDGGATWAPSKRSGIRSSNAPAVLEGLPDGRIVIAWNNCYGMPMHGVRYSIARQCLHAAVSDDDLATLRGCRMIVKKEPGDPDNVLNCYPFSSLAGPDQVYLRLFTVQSKDGEDWREPNGKLVKMGVDFLYETGKKDDLRGGVDDWVTDGSWEGGNSLRLTAAKDGIGHALVNFPYGRKGRLSLRYGTSKGFAGARLILAESYIDRATFLKGEQLEKYGDVIRGSWIEVPLPDAAPGAEGTVIVEWDVTKATMRTDCGGAVTESKLPPEYGGLNHAGIVLEGGDGQDLSIRAFEEQSTEAWLETGIRK